MTDYKFKSEITKDCVPFGVSFLSEIKREEISNLLKIMHEKSKKEMWIEMFFISRINSDYGWNEESILSRLKQLRSDIDALKGKLKE